MLRMLDGERPAWKQRQLLSRAKTGKKPLRSHDLFLSVFSRFQH